MTATKYTRQLNKYRFEPPSRHGITLLVLCSPGDMDCQSVNMRWMPRRCQTYIHCPNLTWERGPIQTIRYGSHSVASIRQRKSKASQSVCRFGALSYHSISASMPSKPISPRHQNHYGQARRPGRKAGQEIPESNTQGSQVGTQRLQALSGGGRSIPEGNT